MNDTIIAAKAKKPSIITQNLTIYLSQNLAIYLSQNQMSPAMKVRNKMDVTFNSERKAA